VIQDFKEILDKVSDPWDLATVLIVGTAGFLVDAGLNAIGFLSPGQVAITAASGALGAKKAADAVRAKTREQRAAEQKRTAAIDRADKLAKLLEREGYSRLAERVKSEVKLFQDGITEVDDLAQTIGEAIQEYREATRSSSDPP
jgi:hypothetical protein